MWQRYDTCYSIVTYVLVIVTPLYDINKVIKDSGTNNIIQLSDTVHTGGESL